MLDLRPENFGNHNRSHLSGRLLKTDAGGYSFSHGSFDTLTILFFPKLEGIGNRTVSHFGNDQFDELISLVRRRNTLMNELGRDPEGFEGVWLQGTGIGLYDMVNALDEQERNYILRAFEHEGPGLVRTMFDDGGTEDSILFDEAEPPPRGPQRRGFAPAATIWDAAPRI